MKNCSAPIGIFDSGIGGLTVLKEISRILPQERIIYLGDTARVPYGIRSPETVTRYSFECSGFLIQQEIKLLVVACNTVSAISLASIRENVSIPVIGVIEPGARAAAAATRSGKIGIIGTETTIRSSAYVKAIQALDKDLEAFGMACPLFVPLVEEGWTDGPIARMVVEKYLSGMVDKEVDTLVLGCTHYPLLKGVIQEVMGEVRLIDSAVETALVVQRMLADTDLLGPSGDPAPTRFFVTDSPDKFIAVGERFLQKRIEDIDKISL
ncbi:MAG: glutamate racemase [Nitrospirota bacterium]